MTEGSRGAYNAVLPADVRYDDELKPNAKILYAEITALCDSRGYCWATNGYFAKLYNVTEATVSRWVSQLDSKGYIRCEMVPTSTGIERRIYAGIFIVTRGEVDKKVKTPLDKKRKTGLDKNVNTPKGNIFNSFNDENLSLPPKAPQGAAPPGEKRRSREIKPAPDWKPDRFVGFWQFYPRHENKQGAIRAWDKLQPGDELIDRMGKALKRLKATEAWRDGIGIPHASTWLNNARWEDADDLPEKPGASRGGWAVDEEVIK